MYADSSQAKQQGIPPGARWTKIDRRLVNPEALEEAKERFEERLDCVIVLRVLTKEDIQKLADRTRKIRGKRRKPENKPWSFHTSAKSGFLSNMFTLHLLIQHSSTADERAYEEERAEKKAARRRERNRDLEERGEFIDDSEDEFKPKPPRMLEAPSSTAAASYNTAGASSEADFIRDNRDRRGERERDRESEYMSGGRGPRD